MDPEEDVTGFLSAVFHDLRGGLQSMIIFTRILRDEDIDAAARARALESLDSSLQTQARLIQDLQDLSALVGGRFTVNSERCDLKPVILMTIETWRRAAAGRNIAIEPRLPPEKVPIVGDMDRLQALLDRILSNAVNATPDGGRVDIELAVRDDAAVVTVLDKGCGIPQELLPKLFEPFRRRDKTAGGRGGFALGLSIARHLAELHGGTLTVDSAGPGQGAAAVLRLPLSA